MTNYQQNPSISFQVIDEKTFLFNPETLEMFELNETSAYIWNKLKKATNHKAIINSMTEEYQVERNQLEADVKQVIELFLKEKLIMAQ